MEFSNQPQVIVLCGLILLVTVLWMIFRVHAKSKKSNYTPPEPAGAWPIIGHLHLLGANKLLHHLFGDMADKLGPIFSLKLGTHKTLVVSSWEIARECFTEQDRVLSGRPRSLAVKIMGYDHEMIGFLPIGTKWRNLRKLVMVELLSNRRLDQLKHIPESEVDLFIKGLYQIWKSKGEKSMPVVELTERFRDLSMNIVVRMVAGKRYFGNGGYENEESRRFQKASEDFLHLIGLFMVSDAVPLFGWIDSLSGYKGRMKKTAKDIDHVLEGWINEHHQKRKLSCINESEQDFMHVMLSIMESDPDAQISDTSIKATCLSLLLGGYDTTLVTLTWAVSLLLNNRHVLGKVQDELEKHIGRDRQVKESDVLHLTLAQLLHGFELGTASDLPIDMTEGPGLTNPKATPLEVTIRPRLAPSLYV
ncbi:Xanthotoxin hydroxylase CYP82C [Heracleum sosnowskyi]|uniref:Xanthotoxin hydroxylase CYP82C n=1 Tax=Heracleum sosnowskyi TaxID=360622 RepID=A0AAD8J347_9APIA|nr:Xanthotoxin hydroxylase CYP82C [Heracleum sosnowskyi]